MSVVPHYQPAVTTVMSGNDCCLQGAFIKPRKRVQHAAAILLIVLLLYLE